jgi:hypothetical protein
MEEIIKRLDAIELKLDTLLYYLAEEQVEEMDGDEHGRSRDEDAIL